MRKAGTPNKSSEIQRQRIIAAALACFSELGFAETTMEDIRSRSGASNGSIYHHFGSKSSLAASVYLQGIMDYQGGLLAALEAHEDARSGIRAIVDFHLKWIGKQRDWARFLARMRYAEFVTDVESDIAAQNRLFMTRVLGWFRPFIDAGEMREVPYDMVIPLIIGPVQEFTRFLLEDKSRTRVTAAADELARAAWMALKAEGKD